MSRRLVRFLPLFVFGLLAAAALRAQTVRWEPAGGSLAVRQTTELQLIFDGCTPEENLRLPKVDGLTLEFVGKSTSTSIINFTRSDSVTLTFAANLAKKQRVTIPSFEVNTNKGRLRTPVATFDAGEATVGATGISLDNAAAARLVAAPTSVWAGEVFNLNYTLDAARSYTPDFGRGQFEWNPEPLLAEEWSRPEPSDFRAGTEPRTGLAYRTRALARAPGSIRLNAVRQLLNLGVGVTGFGFFQQRQYQQFSITSTAPLLEVKALPPAPAGFTGAVGSVKLSSKIVPLTATVGEPITWTLELTGTANWPDITGLPSRDVSRDFQVISPQAKRTVAEGKLFDATLAEDVVLVPTKPGTYTLGPISFAYFDPKRGAYQTVTTPATTVTVTAALALPSSAPTTDSSAPSETTISVPKSKILPAAAPAALPRDPLPGADLVSLPLAPRAVLLLLAAPFVPLLGYWLWLALVRARATDPLNTRRAAHARLAALLTQLRATPATRAQLLRWQHDTSALLQIAAAAPTPNSPEIENSKSKIPNLPTLWAESDRALYGENVPLPADWPARAQAALSAAPVPAFSPVRLFRAANLFPFLFALIFALLLSPASLTAAESAGPLSSDEAASAYRRGDFAAAEKSYRATLAARPTDAVARHNLSIALAQQDRWDEAAAQAAAALVQSPASEPIQAQFALAAEKSGHVPPALAAFLAPGPGHSAARLASPATWQRLLLAAGLTMAISLGLLLACAYGRGSRATVRLSCAALLLGFCTAATALACWHTYGETADVTAVVVWRAGVLRSIPTEADTAQKTTPLAAGSLALADKAFLGWQHVTFDAGQAGWVRREELVSLWK